jgi:hypothetical protein
MTTGPYVQLPDDLDLLRVPERAHLASLRVALTLTEQALLAKHPVLRRAPFPSVAEPRPTTLARALLVRGAELHAMADAYERLLADVRHHEDHECDEGFSF